jgi:toxin CptA
LFSSASDAPGRVTSMHSAPAVTYPVGRSHFQAWLALAILLLAAALMALWLFQAGHAGWRLVLAACVWLFCTGMVLRSARHSCTGLLRWDGQNWQWESGSKVMTGAVVPHLDWQAGLLLEFRTPEHRVQWLWLMRGAEPLRWDALRRALWAAGLRQPAQTAGQP